jgi:predicted anti-sigma-YlaC factor YlaD
MPTICRQTIRVICEYLEGKLAPSDVAAVRGHLGRCQNCRLVHEAANQTLREYFDDDVAIPFHAVKVA